MRTKQHSGDENLIGYIYRTLDDAQREVIDAHLVNCQICRARLTEYEARQREIDHDLRAVINGVSPSRQMTFSAIAPRLQRRRPFDRLWPRLATAVPIATAVTGLLFSLYGLWQILPSLPLTAQPHQPGALPTLASFCFVFVSMEQFDRAFSMRPRFLITVLLAFILWLGTAVIGLINILVIRDLVLAGYVAAGGSYAAASAMAILVIIVMAVVYIAAVIGGAEYHYKRIGQPGSWKLFSWTIVIQLLIMILPHFVF